MPSRWLVPGLLAAASAPPAARALAVDAGQQHQRLQGASPEVKGYTLAPGLVLTRYAAGDATLRSAAVSAARCDEMGDLCAGFTCNSDALVCSVRAPTMLQSSGTGEVTYQKSADALIMSAVNEEATAGLKVIEAEAAKAVQPWVVRAPSPPPASFLPSGSRSSWFGGDSQASSSSWTAPPSPEADPDPYMARSADVLAVMQQARQAELSVTRQQVQATKGGEATQIAAMKAAITQARKVSLPQVVLAAEEWTRSEVQRQAVELESSYLQRALIYEERAEELRQTASASTKDALRVAGNMVELAKEAEDVAKHLHGSHAEEFTARLLAEDSEWKDIAAQSQRFSKLAEQMIRGAAILASKALAQAKKSEEDANKALKTAQENTQRLAAIKKRAEALLNLANRR